MYCNGTKKFLLGDILSAVISGWDCSSVFVICGAVFSQITQTASASEAGGGEGGGGGGGAALALQHVVVALVVVVISVVI